MEPKQRLGAATENTAEWHQETWEARAAGFYQCLHSKWCVTWEGMRRLCQLKMETWLNVSSMQCGPPSSYEHQRPTLGTMATCDIKAWDKYTYLVASRPSVNVWMNEWTNKQANERMNWHLEGKGDTSSKCTFVYQSYVDITHIHVKGQTSHQNPA